jgi:hypothetical protein
MRIPGALVAFACLVSLAAFPSRAAGQTQTITCESEDDKRRDCYVGGLDQGSVSLDKQLSKANCSKGYSWGTSSNNIWVSRGCRARLSYRARSGQSSSGGGSRYGQITCESRGNDRKECYVSELDQSSVTMEEKLSESSCINGRSWGTGNNKIWVSNGCRARFGYTRRSGGGNDNYRPGNGGNASVSSMREACIQRAARDWSVTQENLEIAGTNRLDDGSYEFVVASKRTRGSCFVDSNGRVRKLSTY